jgi:ethanolamine ammonia-lyase small subunit
MIPTAVLLAAHGGGKPMLESDEELQRPQRYLPYLSWAGSAPTRVASGRTGVRAKAATPLRARNSLHRPERTLG